MKAYVASPIVQTTPTVATIAPNKAWSGPVSWGIHDSKFTNHNLGQKGYCECGRTGLHSTGVGAARTLPGRPGSQVAHSRRDRDVTLDRERPPRVHFTPHF